MKPYYEHGGIRIIHGDCREIVPGLPPVDHVITDPPYSDRTHKGHRNGDDMPCRMGVFQAQERK